MNHVVMFSGGVGSWATARRVADRYGTDRLTMLVANTNTEAGDWADFVRSCHNDVGGELVVLDNGGRDIWDVFGENRFIGNTRADVCSRVLKREPLRTWLEDRFTPDEVIVYLGFDWTEAHRLERARPYWEPYEIAAPLCDPPLLEKQAWLDELKDRGIATPVLYERGFPHNNCGGGCVKAGQASWELLLRTDKARFLWNETCEERLRSELGKDVAILRDRTFDRSRPLPLRKFRERIEAQPALFDADDWGACSCMIPEDDPSRLRPQ